MRREKDIFEIEIQIQKFYQKARSELKKAIRDEEEEYDCEEQVEELLEKLEKLDEKKLKQISEELDDESLKDKCEDLLQEIETARKHLNQGNLYELKNYLQDIESVLKNSGFVFSEEKNEHWAHYFIGNALHGVNRAIDYKEAEAELEGHTEELLKRIESADEEEINQIQENLESSNQEEGFEVELEEKCGELWKETEKAREHLKNEEYKEALNYVEQVGKILKSIKIDLEHVERLENDYEIDEENPINENHVYPLKNRGDLLIKFNVSLRSSKKLKKLIDQMPDEVNITDIVEVGLYEGDPAQIIRRAPGRQIQHAEDQDQLMSDIANAPQEHFDKLVRDSEKMARYGLRPDASDNLFYSKEKGFVWIDPLIYDIVDRKEKGLDSDRFDYFGIVVPKHDASNDEDKKKARQIVSKLKEAGAPESSKSLDKALNQFMEGGGVPDPY
jgi:hypothetical protein